MKRNTPGLGILYQLLQVVTLLGGAILCLTLTAMVQEDQTNSTLFLNNLRALQYLSGLGAASALLSLLFPTFGRTVLRGYYWFFFLVSGLATTFSVRELFKEKPATSLLMTKQYIAVSVALAMALRILAQPKREEPDPEL